MTSSPATTPAPSEPAAPVTDPAVADPAVATDPAATNPAALPGSLPQADGSRRVVRNVAVTLGTQLLSWALTFAVTLSLPRYAGDTGLGKMAFAASLAALFGTVIPLGTSTVLVREIARDRSRTGELLWAAILLRVPLGLLMTGLLIGTISVLHWVSPGHYSELTRTLVIIAALGMMLGAVNDALASALQGQENLTRQNVAALSDKFLASGLLILLIFLRQPLWMLASVTLLTALVSLSVNAAAFRPLLPTLRRPSRETLRLLALSGLPFFALSVFPHDLQPSGRAAAGVFHE